MARSKSFFGLRRGSTREHTFYIQDGEQVTRSRVAHVKNPRSLAQMQQRMIMTTAIAAYKGLKEIVDHSWEGVDYGAKSFQKFMSVNTKLLKDNMIYDTNTSSFANYRQKKMFDGNYFISEGSLINQMNTRLNIPGIEERAGHVVALVTLPIYDELTISTPTMKEWCDIFNINDNGYITIVATCCADNIISFVSWLRIKPLVYSDEIINISLMSTESSNTKNTLIAASPNQTAMEIYFPFSSRNIQINIGIISSQLQNNNNWLRSSAQLRLGYGKETFQRASDALATYPISHNYILNGK